MDARRIHIMRRSLWLLLRHRLRSSLIVASAAVGVAGVVCPFNYGASGSKQLLDQIRRMGSNVLIITPTQDKALAGRARTGALVTTLVERDHAAIQRDVSSRTRSSALVNGAFWIKAGDLSKNVAVIGCQSDYFAIKNWPVDSGGLFSVLEDRSMARVAVLGRTVAVDLFGTESPLGRRIMINRVPFTVVGVLAERGQGLDVSNEDNQVYVPLSTAMHRLMNLDHYSAIVLEISSIEKMDLAAAQAKSILHQLHHIRANQTADFQIQNQKTLLETQSAASDRLGFFLRWIGGSALAVSGLGILGIAWIATKERTRDLGTCRALGATAKDIFFQIWFENTALALAGGFFGLLMAWAISRWTSTSNNLPFVFDGLTAAIAFASAATLNLAFSLLPSRKAALVHPIEALRHE
jgi:putative ABC transport system permease protein